MVILIYRVKFVALKEKIMENYYLQEVQDYINCCNPEDKENLSDGFHTFKELYEFRKVYNAALFNEWAKKLISLDTTTNPITSENIYSVHKSWRHFDGELCFGGGWFIVVAVLPTGQISNHYEEKDWDLFKIPEVEKSLFEFDNHTTTDVINRLKSL